MPWPALAVTAAVTLLLLLPVPATFADLGRGELFEIGKDKFAHFALFVPLAWAWLTGGGRRGAGPARAARGAGLFVALVAWGGAIELVQGWTGWRRGEWSDLVADALGVAIAFAGHAVAERRARGARRPAGAPL